MTKTLVLNPLSLDPDAHASLHSFATEGESMTVQSDCAPSDINNIVKQFGLTHELPYGRLQPFYDDISDWPTDFHEAQNFIAEAQSNFMLLPAEQRSEFNNDAGAFVDFLRDDRNRQKAIDMGLIAPPDLAPAVPLGTTEEEASA